MFTLIQQNLPKTESVLNENLSENIFGLQGYKTNTNMKLKIVNYVTRYRKWQAINVRKELLSSVDVILFCIAFSGIYVRRKILVKMGQN
jgi:hypothetical protein